jgi:ribosomal protein L29
MSKKLTLTNHSADEINTLVADKREEHRLLRFSVAGSKNRNVKLARTLRKDIARGLTELSSRVNAAK